jgi:transposase
LFQVHGVDASGHICLRRTLRRKLLQFFAVIEPCTIGIEACHSAHSWGRELERIGHTFRLIPTQYVKPYLVGGENDANEATAICAALGRKDIPDVGIKSAEQQSIQSLHRMRERLIHERTAKSNQIRSLFSEEGFVFPISVCHLRTNVAALVGDLQTAINPITETPGCTSSGAYRHPRSLAHGAQRRPTVSACATRIL